MSIRWLPCILWFSVRPWRWPSEKKAAGIAVSTHIHMRCPFPPCSARLCSCLHHRRSKGHAQSHTYSQSRPHDPNSTQLSSSKAGCTGSDPPRGRYLDFANKTGTNNHSITINHGQHGSEHESLWGSPFLWELSWRFAASLFEPFARDASERAGNITCQLNCQGPPWSSCKNATSANPPTYNLKWRFQSLVQEKERKTMCACLSPSCGLLCLILAKGLQTLVSSGSAEDGNAYATGRDYGVSCLFVPGVGRGWWQEPCPGCPGLARFDETGRVFNDGAEGRRLFWAHLCGFRVFG
jgi:hypothetical protein